LLTGEPFPRARGFADAYQSWRTARALRSTLVHGPNYFLPAGTQIGVITIHDLSVFRYPEFHPAERVSDFERNLKRSVDNSDQLITDCETIRQEVIEFAGLAPERVTAVPLGISEVFRPMPLEECAPVLRQYGLPLTGYGLSLSTLEPRKRIDRLLRAWRELPRSIRDRYPLVIAGASGWNNQELHEQIGAAAGEGGVLPLGFVAEADLPAIYSGAVLFAYPSVYEGFGLPPLEAMASGVPVIVAADSCLPEVTRGAAMVADPDDIAEFARTLLRAIEDDTWRSEAVSGGINVAAGYTWARCIDETVAVYQQVISRFGGGG
jgi:alpha-1,3-rhamnosyl/mannosyltransferase